MSSPIYSIKGGGIFFPGKVIAKELNILIYSGDKICLIGKNGEGKSTLLKAISGDIEIDSEEIFIAPGIKIFYLRQEERLSPFVNVKDYVIESTADKNCLYKADMFIQKLQLDPRKKVSELSGGQLRRMQLAKALASNADILLLDEPTNHLDIKAIEWLETYIKSYHGSVICISHDKTFLENVTNKIWWLDRTTLYKSDKGFAHFPEWQEEILNKEHSALNKLNKLVNEENQWLRQGLSARRKRNQGRLEKLKIFREQLKEGRSKSLLSNKKIEKCSFDESIKTRFIISAENISFKYQEKAIIKDFNLNIFKGEKLGVIGPNGIGKSTLVKLLTKELEPTNGSVKYGTNLEITYFDQHRSTLNPNENLWQVLCPNGGHHIVLHDHTMHVSAYLKRFMFDPKLLNSKVDTLSGGSTNRLMLAKALIKPGNLMILDEPTNDLDMDSIEMLLDILSDYPGTVIVVSHDRDFLDKLVTSTLVFEETGNIVLVPGGYKEYVKYYKSEGNEDAKKTKNNDVPVKKISSSKVPTKLSYQEQRTLDKMPEQINLLEQQVEYLEKKLSDNELYLNQQDQFLQYSKELADAKENISALLDLWDNLEKKNIQLASHKK